MKRFHTQRQYAHNGNNGQDTVLYEVMGRFCQTGADYSGGDGKPQQAPTDAAEDADFKKASGKLVVHQQDQAKLSEVFDDKVDTAEPPPHQHCNKAFRTKPSYCVHSPALSCKKLHHSVSYRRVTINCPAVGATDTPTRAFFCRCASTYPHLTCPI